jgi:hypothetical protein
MSDFVNSSVLRLSWDEIKAQARKYCVTTEDIFDGAGNAVYDDVVSEALTALEDCNSLDFTVSEDVAEASLLFDARLVTATAAGTATRVVFIDNTLGAGSEIVLAAIEMSSHTTVNGVPIYIPDTTLEIIKKTA